jgi:predicted DNA-binding protein
MPTRTTKVYSITMPPEMGRRAEQLAKRENRTMSELLRETFRRYENAEAERQMPADPTRARRLAQFQRLVGELQQEAKQKGLDNTTMREIDAEIAAVRKARGRKKPSKQPRP